ncbi:hypothetical protein JB92DRAFT_2827878 [Gautieria morchelliformis]|nr:hypothetical protein JB92DRAFT_2827878 [Gautieria morchelliformis]
MADQSGISSEPKVQCWIEMNGRRLPKYCEEKYEKDGSIFETCWIASEVGKTFSIKVERANVQLLTMILINGVLVHRSVSNERSDGWWAVEATNDGQTGKKFEFSTVDATSESTVHGSHLNACTSSTSGDKNIKDCGTIKVTHYRVKDVVKTTNGKIRKYTVDALDQPLMLHKMKKLIGMHAVCLRDAGLITGDHEKYAYTPIDVKKPWYTFLFRYRSIDYLQAERIARLPGSLKRRHSITQSEDSASEDEADFVESIKREEEEHRALDDIQLERRREIWQEQEKQYEQEYRNEEEELQKKKQALTGRLQAEARDQEEKYEKERQEQEEAFDKERQIEEETFERERQENFEKKKREREEKFEKRSGEQEKQCETEGQQREGTHVKEKQQRERKRKKLEERYAQAKAQREQRHQDLLSQFSPRRNRRKRDTSGEEKHNP